MEYKAELSARYGAELAVEVLAKWKEFFNDL